MSVIKRIVRLVLWVITISAISILLISLLLSTAILSNFSQKDDILADCGLVFGAAVHRGGEAGPGIRRRVYTAARLYNEDKLAVLFMSGGKGSPESVSEAAVMKDVAVELGVASQDVFIEERATSTIQNLTFSYPMMKECDSTVGISDRYHLARIEYIAWRMGWKNFSVYPSDRNANTKFEVYSVIREMFGLLYTVITFHP